MVTKEYIEKLIAKNNTQLKIYKSNLEENYLHYFEWLADKIFKLEWKNNVLNTLLSIFNDGDNKNAVESVERLRERYRIELTTQSLMTSSTNALTNLASLWECECKQNLIADLS